MTNGSYLHRSLLAISFAAAVCFWFAFSPAFAQQSAPRDPAEPQQGRPHPKVLPRPAGAVARKSVDEKSMRALIDQLVSCGTRLSLSSWTDAKRGIGCGRDYIVARLDEIAKDSGGKLQIVVDKFDSTSERTSGKPLPLQSVYAILPGSDPKLAKTIFIVSGHYDSRPSDVMNTDADAPGADDDASGVSVSVESARLLSKAPADGKGGYRATLLFAAISGEEQGLLGGYRLLEWAKQQGYTIGGMLDDDIVGDDPSPGAPHRVRLFSGNGEIDDCDSPGRELARAIEEIDGRHNIRMIFRVDRYGTQASSATSPATMQRLCVNWQWLPRRQQMRSSRAPSLRTRKSPGLPKTTRNAPASKSCGVKPRSHAGRSTTSPQRPARRCYAASRPTIISSPSAPSARMVPAPSPCPQKSSAARRHCRPAQSNSYAEVRRMIPVGQPFLAVLA